MAKDKKIVPGKDKFILKDSFIERNSEIFCGGYLRLFKCHFTVLLKCIKSVGYLLLGYESNSSSHM